MHPPIHKNIEWTCEIIFPNQRGPQKFGGTLNKHPKNNNKRVPLISPTLDQ